MIRFRYRSLERDPEWIALLRPEAIAAILDGEGPTAPEPMYTGWIGTIIFTNGYQMHAWATTAQWRALLLAVEAADAPRRAPLDAAVDVGERPRCKVCYSEADDEGDITHGRGCYHLSADGGGVEHTDWRPPAACPACGFRRNA